jgi:hypothetical protein
VQPAHADNTALFVLEYADGFRGYVLMLPGYSTDFAYAARVGGEVQACAMNLHGGLRGGATLAHFSYLCRNIETFVRDRISHADLGSRLLLAAHTCIP